ncbi:hypothetical protein RJ640_017202, partial [Escallonia rubra]
MDYDGSSDDNCYSDCQVGDNGYGYDDFDDDNDRYSDSLDECHDPEAETDFPFPGKAPLSKVITKESLLAAQREDLQRVMDLLSLKEYHARTLLIHFRWDVDKVFAVLVEKGKDKLYMEAGVTMEEHDGPSAPRRSFEVMCDICMEEIPANKTTMMDCGHCFCNNCWTLHFTVKINEGQSRRIRCMAHKCNAICDEGKINMLVKASDPALAKKFDRFLLESYIEDNRRVKWCPSAPHCGNAIRVEDDEYCEVECACGLQFCFSCSSQPHSPCSCLMWNLWAKKCKDESETVNWITVNTKFCPKCQKPVEKNGLQHTWNGIAGHTCGRFKEDAVQKTDRAIKDLARYVHYHNRHKAHTDSFKAEVSLKEKIQEKITNLEATDSTFRDFSWLSNGLERLFRSRRILSYSYPFAYYMFGDELFQNEMTTKEREIKQNLFEDQQQQLEANVERLSMILEEPFDEYAKDKVMETRMKTITQSALTDKLCQQLYECIDNDLLNNIQRASHIIAPY